MQIQISTITAQQDETVTAARALISAVVSSEAVLMGSESIEVRWFTVIPTHTTVCVGITVLLVPMYVVVHQAAK